MQGPFSLKGKLIQPNSRQILSTKEFQDIKFDLDNIKTHYVHGNTSSIKTNHPVITAVIERYLENSKPGHRNLLDRKRIALCIEGGGMRGCVAAGSAG